MTTVKIIDTETINGREYALVGRYGSMLPESEDYGINQYIVCCGITYDLVEDAVNEPIFKKAKAEWDHGYYFNTDSLEEAKEFFAKKCQEERRWQNA